MVTCSLYAATTITFEHTRIISRRVCSHAGACEHACASCNSREQITAVADNFYSFGKSAVQWGKFVQKLGDELSRFQIYDHSMVIEDGGDAAR